MPSLPNLPMPGLSRADEAPSPDELMRIYFRRHLAAAGAGAGGSSRWMTSTRQPP